MVRRIESASGEQASTLGGGSALDPPLVVPQAVKPAAATATLTTARVARRIRLCDVSKTAATNC
jgi:hypothetical protein